MKLKFKKQEFQTRAVDAVIDCFKGQQYSSGVKYRIDPGSKAQGELFEDGFKNADISLSSDEILSNIQEVQRLQNLPISPALVSTKISPINLDIEMETGTGKTYCYIKTMFEMYKRFGWSKFIVVVPSIAIREGVKKSFEITAEHFLEAYGKKTRFFIYNSKQLHNLEDFSSNAGINVMIVNVQAFNARGKDNRRIYEVRDDFQSRRPIDVIKANRPILIIDEPQKIEGDGKKKSTTFDSLSEFDPLFILRYSATHKKHHNKIYRLDALDAYNQKLVKKISVRGISVKGLSGTNAYLYLESIEISRLRPVARIELEIRQKSGIRRTIRKLGKGDNLFVLSGELDQYKGFVISEINAITDTVEFTNGHQLHAGEATGDVNETTLRRIQIREAIRVHFEKEKALFALGIKVLSLFFIDEVAKYRVYDGSDPRGGEYAIIFEEEYLDCLNEQMEDLFLSEGYKKYLKSIPVNLTHNGYFSVDKKSKRMVDSVTGKRSSETDDVDAYDLILKDKESLLSFPLATDNETTLRKKQVRFIFSHSALREGWDNPNVFVICTLKHSSNIISRRQEVGRGLRIAVNQLGERQDDPATVHQTNVLTVIASESYKDFVSALQSDISESLSERPRFANVAYFEDKVMLVDGNAMEVTAQMARQIYKYLVKNDYTDDDDNIAKKYHSDIRNGTLAAMPETLKPYKTQIIALINSVFCEANLPQPENDRAPKTNPLNDNFHKQEFKELWSRINHRAIYTVHFDQEELIKKCVDTIDRELVVAPLQYTIQKGEQNENIDFDDLKQGDSFTHTSTSHGIVTRSIHSTVKYDLIGKIAESTKLTRKTVSAILLGISDSVFVKFQTNPESFISEAIRLINEQKATVIVEHLAYDSLAEKHSIDIFTKAQSKQDFSKAGTQLKNHIYDYCVTDSVIERDFVTKLDTSEEVVVYAKLPKGFKIPTPVGDYNPDWAISFRAGVVKHVYFVAETKGSMSSLELREIESARIKCARKFFDEINRKINPKNVKYDVVNSFEKLMEVVGVGDA